MVGLVQGLRYDMIQYKQKHSWDNGTSVSHSKTICKKASRTNDSSVKQDMNTKQYLGVIGPQGHKWMKTVNHLTLSNCSSTVCPLASKNNWEMWYNGSNISIIKRACDQVTNPSPKKSQYHIGSFAYNCQIQKSEWGHLRDLFRLSAGSSAISSFWLQSSTTWQNRTNHLPGARQR